MIKDSLSSFGGVQARKPLADDVIETLRQAIWERQLQPGVRLREEEVAAALNVSRGPVREALKQLEYEGLVIRERNRGATVARLSREDLEEVYSLRMALEVLAVRLAVQNRTARHIAQLHDVLDEMSFVLDQNTDEQRAADLDVRFHEIIFVAANHKRLYHFWSVLKPQIYVFLLTRNVANADFREFMLPGHQAIMDAIEQRDETQAARLIEEHLELAYSRVRTSYEQFIGADQLQT